MGSDSFVKVLLKKSSPHGAYTAIPRPSNVQVLPPSLWYFAVNVVVPGVRPVSTIRFASVVMPVDRAEEPAAAFASDAATVLSPDKATPMNAEFPTPALDAFAYSQM